MKHTHTPIPYDEWARMGSDVKQMRETLFRLWFQGDLQSHLTKTEQDKGFRKIETGITTLQSQLESAMFKGLGHDYENTHEVLCVFYDSPAGLDPHPEPKKKDGR